MQFGITSITFLTAAEWLGQYISKSCSIQLISAITSDVYAFIT